MRVNWFVAVTALLYLVGGLWDLRCCQWRRGITFLCYTLASAMLSMMREGK